MTRPHAPKTATTAPNSSARSSANATATSAASTAKARIELTRNGPEKPWLGQLVPIAVDVWRPEGDPPLEPFSLDDVVAAGMIVKWSEHAPPPDEKQQGETHFLVQHRTLLVFPESDGELTVPPLVARWTDAATKAETTAHSEPLHFTAAVPPGAGDALPLVASSVTLQQAFDRGVSGLRVGDGFTRTLTLRASDTDPVVFPELPLAEVSGMTAYPSGPRAQSSDERGQIRAEQTLRVTYVIDRVGPHRMQGVSLRWLEPRSGRYLTASVPDTTIWAAPNPSLGFQCLGTARAASIATEIGSLGTVVLLLTVLVRRRRRGPGRWERALKERGRERRAFRDVLHAVRHGPALLALQRIYAWLSVRFRGGLDRTLDPLTTASPEASAACKAFEEHVFRDGKTAPPAPAFVSMLRRARKAMGHGRRAVALESLNPARADKGGSR